MRELTDHKINETLNESLKIVVVDEPGAGGASHKYRIEFPVPTGAVAGGFQEISFQNGPIKEAGVNGITQEALLAIVIDRLRSFQAGPYSCRENALALTHIETALLWLQSRTRARLARGVEGTSAK